MEPIFGESYGKMRNLGDLPWYADNMIRPALETLDRYKTKIEKLSLQVNHPLLRVDPDGCVPVMFRALINSGVEAHYTQVTYPLKLPK